MFWCLMEWNCQQTPSGSENQSYQTWFDKQNKDFPFFSSVSKAYAFRQKMADMKELKLTPMWCSEVGIAVYSHRTCWSCRLSQTWEPPQPAADTHLCLASSFLHPPFPWIPRFPHFPPPSGSGWRESWETKGDSPISPSPCRFGSGLVSCRCQSAIWWPLPADSCKATRVRATRTKWCWEERSANTINHPQVLNFKNQLEESPFQVIEDLTSQMRKVKKMRPLAYFSTVPASCWRGVKIAPVQKWRGGKKKKTADCWICKTATRVTSR